MYTQALQKVIERIEETLEKCLHAEHHVNLLMDSGSVYGTLLTLDTLGLVDSQTLQGYIEQLKMITSLIEMEVIDIE